MTVSELVGFAVVKKHVFGGGRSVSETVADVPAEGNASRTPEALPQYQVL
jgi:hypothetical protein